MSYSDDKSRHALCNGECVRPIRSMTVRQVTASEDEMNGLWTLVEIGLIGAAQLFVASIVLVAVAGTFCA